MSGRLEEFDHLKIKMEDILSATNDFSPEKLIGGGGFGPVYKGKLSLSGGPAMVAFKRLDLTLGQGNTEFWKEIMMLSKYKHENLVSLLHFAVEGNESVLVYEYVSRGSLDRYLSDPSLTWSQRLEICIGAAQALKYLHDPHETQQRVLHRDIKSSNILLDEEWRAKVSDFGLSKIGPANQPQTFLVSNAVGTVGYCDPLYMQTGVLSKESDVYSFGVVLFEVMCGTLCTKIDHNGKLSGILVGYWKKCCRENKVNCIIFKDIEDQMSPDSITTFSAIANRCLMIDSTQRPTMDDVLKELQVAIDQNKFQDSDLVKISKLAVSPLPYTSEKELIPIFSKGILVDEGKRWVSINQNQEIIELIAATECIDGEGLERYKVSGNQSRFSHTKMRSIQTSGDLMILTAQVRTRFLVPGITYTINLVYEHELDRGELSELAFEYKLEGETHYSMTRPLGSKKDGWLTAELYEFTSYQKEHDFKIEICVLENEYSSTAQYEGIMFQPKEHETHENLEDQVMQQISNLDMGWEETLLYFIDNIIPLSKNNVEWTTMEELYFLLRKGFLIAGSIYEPSDMWFRITKTMKVRYMLPAREVLKEEEGNKMLWKPLPESRFEVVAESPAHSSTLRFHFLINNKIRSLNKPFSYQLIYKLSEKYVTSQDRKVYKVWLHDYKRTSPFLIGHPPAPTPIIPFIHPHHTPTIPSMVDQNYVKPLRRPKIKHRLKPKARKDGWLEVSLFVVSEDDNEYDKYDFIDFKISEYYTKIPGIIIQGIEFTEL